MPLSISRIKLFKACRRAYELKYVEGLEPVETADALQTGLSYHALLEEMYGNGGKLPEGTSKELAMATAYRKYVYPFFKVASTENWVAYDDILVGRVDGITSDGVLVEHKTTSSEITEEYEYDLQWDEQILAYMLMTGTRKVWYTVCRKPTIRQKKNESEEEFFDRMVEWFDEDTDSKIRVLEITRTDDEVEQFRQDLEAISHEVYGCTNYYRNTAYCKKWGRRCEYSSICLQYDPEQEYIDFVRTERRENSGDQEV